MSFHVALYVLDTHTALQLLLIEEQLWELQLEAQRVYILCRGFEIWLWLSI